MKHQGIETDDLLYFMNQQASNSTIALSDNSLITVSSARELRAEAENIEELKPLYEPYFYEGECCILFADTNVGKSIFSVQIADEISRQGHKVLYLDFEMSMRQFASRCRDEQGNIYEFHDNFMRGSINLDALRVHSDDNYENSLIETIENRIEVFDPQVVIIDNLTYLCIQSESGAEAGTLMRRLIDIKNRYGISMLVISHTPKRNLWDPITENSLAGSKRIANFADSMFAIGKSAIDEEMRYVKQIKSRSGEIVHGAQNVQACYIDRVDGLLRFITMGNTTEEEHLRRRASQSKVDHSNDIKRMLAQGTPVREIATTLHVSNREVYKVKNAIELKIEN